MSIALLSQVNPKALIIQKTLNHISVSALFFKKIIVSVLLVSVYMPFHIQSQGAVFHLCPCLTSLTLVDSTITREPGCQDKK